ncbi:dTDP-4-dehydrorhamnose 3,5-epimerase [Candidatus Gracilibacteria bacterium]|nr:dTDP-4-dehydrorhamnose 3,5-epimerase [Candidatus Gracilibacteria bacterium]NUJ99025.1 dTDP-4-dehydrorhamnose 3,5-epimerase [Candidatus Gracilibacteria bacterium]
METYNKGDFDNVGINCNFVQDNHSKSKAGVLRGLHFQTKNTQSKLVRVIAGSVYDVALDLRKNSPTFGKWFGVVLNSENKKQLFVPTGFAHGFLTLTDDTEFVYKCDNFYNPESEGGIMWNDEELNINWKDFFDSEKIIISEKDKKNMSLNDFRIINPF